VIFDVIHNVLTSSRSDIFADTYIGELQSVDGYMNIALEGTREFVDGKMRRSYGDAFVRGNNGTFRHRWLAHVSVF
jgi:small nuclear ribonucleoprotein (snRNP)-like protein